MSMGNYSLLEQYLHRFSLSSKSVRQFSFDLEKIFFSPKDSNGSHVFIVGLPRSGTTILLETIYSSNEFASLTYSDMPFVMAPNLWAIINRTSHIDKKRQERAHGDGVFVSTASPEAFEEVFWQTFNQKEAFSYFNTYIGLLLRRYSKFRYLSKNNQNIYRIKALAAAIPRSKILITFRHPLQHANSLLRQHLRFSEIQSADPFTLDYMDWIGHKEFGLSYRPYSTGSLLFPSPNAINHWLEQWLLVYDRVLSEVKNLDNVKLVNYESLCLQSSLWENIVQFIEIDDRPDIAFTQSPWKCIEKYDEQLYSDCMRVFEQLCQMGIYR